MQAAPCTSSATRNRTHWSGQATKFMGRVPPWPPRMIFRSTCNTEGRVGFRVASDISEPPVSCFETLQSFAKTLLETEYCVDLPHIPSFPAWVEFSISRLTGKSRRKGNCSKEERKVPVKGRVKLRNNEACPSYFILMYINFKLLHSQAYLSPTR